MEELEVTRVEPAHEDDRGAIVDLIDGRTVRHVGLITCRTGSVRGNHYHERQDQWIHVLDGQVALYYEDRRRESSTVERVEMAAGEMVYIPAGVVHAVVAQEDARLLDLNDYARGEDGDGYERDTVRVDDITGELSVDG